MKKMLDKKIKIYAGKTRKGERMLIFAYSRKQAKVFAKEAGLMRTVTWTGKYATAELN